MTSDPFFYILDDDRNPQPADSVSWGEWFDHYDRVVGFVRQDDISVNTVFVGLDRNYRTNGPPLLFETLVSDRHGYVACKRTGRFLALGARRVTPPLFSLVAAASNAEPPT